MAKNTVTINGVEFTPEEMKAFANGLEIIANVVKATGPVLVKVLTNNKEQIAKMIIDAALSTPQTPGNQPAKI